MPFPGCVNSPIGGGNIDTDGPNRFFGCKMGTLRYEGAQIVTRPLQLPPALMDIPAVAGSEALSQVQYDVIFHFDFFDPPTPAGATNFGHNLSPYSGNGMYYPLQSKKLVIDNNNLTPGKATTLFHYADFSDLFKSV